MYQQARFLMTLTAAIAFLAVSVARADGPAATAITCQRMCPKCGHKIAERLRAMPGVADAQANVETKTIVVVARPQAAPSPRVLWETVEAGGENPVFLQGPSGTFTQKPPF